MNRLDYGKILTSKTVWTNAILLIVGACEYLLANQGIVPLIPARYLVLVAGIANLILRFLTNDSLLKPK